MVYGFVSFVHIIACLILILVILLQAGRGGGLSEGLGANFGQSFFGTKANVFLTRATTASAVLFLVTCLSLNIMISRRSRSLIALQGIPAAKNSAVKPQQEATQSPAGAASATEAPAKGVNAESADTDTAGK